MENGFPEEQTPWIKSTKKKKRKRKHEDDAACQPDSQETLESESVQVNSEEASTANTEENGPSVEKTPKKKRKKKEHKNNTEDQPNSQETLESESIEVNNEEVSTANTEESAPPVEKSPKKKRKKKHENNTEDQPSSEEKPQSDGLKDKVKRTQKGVNQNANMCPDEIAKLEKKFLMEHKDERFADSPARLLTPEDRALMRKNWVEFFKDHPHPEPPLLLRASYKHDEKTREEVEAFIAEHNFYKRLVQGIEANPRVIFRTAIRFFPYRNKGKKPEVPKPPLGTKINRDWSEEDNVIFRDFIIEEMTAQENTAELPFAKVKRKIPFMNAGRCRTQWKNVTCWQIDHKWRVRSEPFSADDKMKLIEGVRDQGVTSEEEINWKKLSKEFPSSSKKELKYYWRNLVKLNHHDKLTFQDALKVLYTKPQKRSQTADEKLQRRKQSLQFEIESTTFRISAMQTKLEKAEANLREVTAELDKTKQNSTDKIVPVFAEVDSGLDTPKTKTVTEAQAIPKTKTVTEAQDTPKTKTVKRKNVNEAQATPKTKTVTDAQATPNTKTVTEAQDTPKTKTVKRKNVNEAQATPKTKTVTEAPDIPKTKTVKRKNVTEAQATPKIKTAQTKSVTEAPTTPETKTVTEAKTVPEVQVDTVMDNSFMDTSINHLSRFFDDDEL